MRVIENYWISWYRGFLKLPLYARLSIAITETESSWVNMCLLMPIALSWMEDISQLVLIHWSVLVCRFIRLIIRWIIRKDNEETARILREEKGVQPLDLLTADSAEPKSIGDYKAFGLYCRGAAKPPGSVEYSMKWLGRLAAIVIDPERCPRTAKEFSEYEFERDKDGNLISAYPDAKNHHIDAVRYGMQPVWKQRGE